MSPFLALGAGLVIAWFAMRSARRSARNTEIRLFVAHAARHSGDRARTGARTGYTDEDRAAAYLAEAKESLEAELRRVRGERAPSLYSRSQARAARQALVPAFGIRMKVRP